MSSEQTTEMSSEDLQKQTLLQDLKNRQLAIKAKRMQDKREKKSGEKQELETTLLQNAIAVLGHGKTTFVDRIDFLDEIIRGLEKSVQSSRVKEAASSSDSLSSVGVASSASSPSIWSQLIADELLDISQIVLLRQWELLDNVALFALLKDAQQDIASSLKRLEAMLLNQYKQQIDLGDKLQELRKDPSLDAQSQGNALEMHKNIVQSTENLCGNIQDILSLLDRVIRHIGDPIDLRFSCMNDYVDESLLQLKTLAEDASNSKIMNIVVMQRDEADRDSVKWSKLKEKKYKASAAITRELGVLTAAIQAIVLSSDISSTVKPDVFVGALFEATSNIPSSDSYSAEVDYMKNILQDKGASSADMSLSSSSSVASQVVSSSSAIGYSKPLSQAALVIKHSDRYSKEKQEDRQDDVELTGFTAAHL